MYYSALKKKSVVKHKNTLWHDGVHQPVHSTTSNLLTIKTLGVHRPVQFPRFRLLGIDISVKT
jgi:hypothetical protein